jgi:hypothetical protein
MDEPCSDKQQRPGRWPGVVRWTRVGAVTGLLAAAGLAAAASPGTAQADTQLGPAWSGYVSFSQPFSSVSADFTVPGATCSKGPGETGPSTLFWVGMQGSSNQIVQTGFEVECINGTSAYGGFHTDLTGTTSIIGQHMQAGDQVHAAVACLLGVCDETVQDVTQNWSDTSSLQASDPGSTLAAVAAESNDGGVTTDQVQVTNAMMNGVPIGQLNPQAETQNPAIYNGLAFLDPFPLDPSGTAFYFFWNGNPGS